MERNLCMFSEDQSPKLERQQPSPPPNVKFGNGRVFHEDLLVDILAPARLPVRHLEQQPPSPPPNGKSGNRGVFCEDLLVEILSKFPVRHLEQQQRPSPPPFGKFWKVFHEDLLVEIPSRLPGRHLEQRPSAPPNVNFANERVFHEALLVEILSRLPVRHLLRLRRVCKSWCALIDDVYFIKRHYQLQCSRCMADKDIPIISCGEPLTAEIDQKFMLNMYLLSKQRGDVPLNLTADLAHDSAASFANAPDLFDAGLLVGVANGFVCFLWGSKNLSLWNPATREFKAIPPCLKYRTQCFTFGLVGFGYDCISNDFKILRGILRNGRELIGHEVYSSTTNSWKKLIREVSPWAPFFICHFVDAYLNGVCYWYGGDSDTRFILSFNFRTEVFEVIDPPQNAIGSEIGYEYNGMIKMYKACLAFVVDRTDLVKAECNFNVWVMTDFDGDSRVPKSWQHVLTLGPFPSSDGLRLGACRMDGDVLFLISPEGDREESVLYNPSTGTFKYLGIWLGASYNYVESLFSLSNTLVQS